ncbi:MAG TPA: alpha/beta hydrolase [Solirubrobacterales bacterium]|nr:alpha/beta hydrolase [Solirubrobacterales bacterium]
MPIEERPFVVEQGPVLRGEAAGEGPPAVLCHGLTATRRYVLHGSKALPRAGYRVLTYDARGHGESDPAPAGEGYGYPRLVADLERVVDSQLGDERFLLGGHSMGAHTAVAYALRHPERLAGLALVGPTYTAPAEPSSLGYWDGLAVALESEGVDGFVAYIGEKQETDPRWRDSVLRFTRERLLRQEHPEALVEALREVPRSRPFESLEELAAIEAPALVVASGDEADPGHPYAAAAAYAEALPAARLVSEEPGESPLAWQGGKLSRALASFYAEAISSSP